eukprot:357067-Chlamydomonas_euryale.AAC.4
MRMVRWDMSWRASGWMEEQRTHQPQHAAWPGSAHAAADAAHLPHLKPPVAAPSSSSCATTRTIPVDGPPPSSAPHPHLLTPDRRGQDAGGCPACVPQRADRARCARRHCQRLPRAPRLRVGRPGAQVSVGRARVWGGANKRVHTPSCRTPETTCVPRCASSVCIVMRERNASTVSHTLVAPHQG